MTREVDGRDSGEGNHILKISLAIMFSKTNSGQKLEDTENMKINTPTECGNTDYRDKESMNGESLRCQERSLRRTEWEMRVCVG